MSDRHTNIIAAYLIPRKNDQILLLRRHNTGYHDGDYSLIAGHVEAGETFTSSIKREAKEEAGIIVTENQLQVAHVQHRKSLTDGSERVDVYFTTENWTGEIKNCEPHKCSDLSWFATNDLPENMVPCVRESILHIVNGRYYSEFGW